MSSVGDVEFGLEISRGIVAKIAMAAIGFVGAIIFARVLGPGGYGAFYLVVTLVNVLDNPVTGWGNACKKRLTEKEFPEDEALGSGLTGAALNVALVVPGMAFVLTYTNIFEIRSLFVPFAVLFVTVTLFAVTNRLLSGRANFSSADWSDTLRSVFTFPLQLGLVLAGFGAAGMVYGLAGATLLTIPYVLYRLEVRPALPSRETLRSIWTYARYSIPNGFVGTTQSRVDILILGALLATTSAVGYYETALKLTIAATFVTDAMSVGLMARVSNLHSRGKSVSRDVNNSLSYTSLLAVPVFFGALAMPEALVVTVYGADFRPAGPFLVGLAFYQVLYTQVEQLGSVVAGLDRPRRNLVVSAASLVVNVVLGVGLFYVVGPVGVVGATIVAEALKYVVLGGTVKRALPDVVMVPRPLRHQALAGGLMFVVVDRAHSLVDVSSAIHLVALVGVGAIVYGTVLGAISTEHRTTAVGILRDART